MCIRDSFRVATIRWHPEYHDIGPTPFSGRNLHLSPLYLGSCRRDAPSHGNLFRDARRPLVPPPRTDRWGDGHVALGGDAPHSGLVLHDHVSNPAGLRIAHDGNRGTVERRGWCVGSISW